MDYYLDGKEDHVHCCPGVKQTRVGWKYSWGINTPSCCLIVVCLLPLNVNFSVGTGQRRLYSFLPCLPVAVSGTRAALRVFSKSCKETTQLIGFTCLLLQGGETDVVKLPPSQQRSLEADLPFEELLSCQAFREGELVVMTWP